MARNALEQGNEAAGETVKGWQEQATKPEEKKLEPPKSKEPDRVRLHFDVPGWVREGVIAAAKAEDTSISQIGAFLLAYALQLYRDGDRELIELLQGSKTLARSLQWGRGIDLADLADRFSEGKSLDP